MQVCGLVTKISKCLTTLQNYGEYIKHVSKATLTNSTKNCESPTVHPFEIEIKIFLRWVTAVSVTTRFGQPLHQRHTNSAIEALHEN